MKQISASLVFVSAFGIAFAAGCSNATQNTKAAPLSAEDTRKQEQASRQAEMDFRKAQINQSNLTPEQKQSLLQQVKPSAGK